MVVVAAAVVGVEAAPVTFTTPVMNGCGVQMYENSPGAEKVNLNSFPLARALESKAPLSAVAVCSRSPSLRQVTVDPTGTVISAGVNFQVLVSLGESSSIFTEVSAARTWVPPRSTPAPDNSTMTAAADHIPLRMEVSPKFHSAGSHYHRRLPVVAKAAPSGV